MSVATFFKAGARGLTAAGDAFTSGVRALGNQATRAQNAIVSLIRTKPEVALKPVMDEPAQFAKVFENMSPDNFKKFDDALSPLGRQKLVDGLEAGGKLDLAKRFDNLDDVVQRAEDATKRIEDSASNLAKQGEDVKIRMPDGTEKTTKYGSKEFWSLIQTGVMVGAGAGLLMWIDKKFEDREEEYKNCMAGCLPHNWDEYEYGNLEKSDLQYSTPETLEEYQITPIDGQPYCKAEMDDCSEFCDQRCEEESEDVRIPFIDPLRDVTREGAEGLGDILNALFGGLFEGMGLDTSMVGYASSASASMIMVFAFVMLLSTMTR
jgi:hypothetical protein